MSHQHIESVSDRLAFHAALVQEIASNASATDYESYVVECLIPAAKQEMEENGDSVIETEHGRYSISFAITNARRIARELEVTRKASLNTRNGPTPSRFGESWAPCS